MPIAKEILNMLEVGRKPFQSIPSPSLALNHRGKVSPLCDTSFRSPNYALRQASIALWVHPLIVINFLMGICSLVKSKSSCMTADM